MKSIFMLGMILLILLHLIFAQTENIINSITHTDLEFTEALENLAFVTDSFSTAVSCDPYAQSNGDYSVCEFTACPGYKYDVGLCQNNACNCDGDTYLTLLNSQGFEVSHNDDSCCLCSQFSYTPDISSRCERMIIQERCYSMESCSGTVQVVSTKVQATLPPEQVIYPAGVQLNFPIANMPPQCSECFSLPYHLPLTSFSLQTCRGQWLFVGAQKDINTHSFEVGAFVRTRHALLPTNSSHLASGPFNGVYWYNVPGLAFGFAPTSEIDLLSADLQGSLSPYRLSWNLDNGKGGFRSGSTLRLNQDSERRKVVYSCT